MRVLFWIEPLVLHGRPFHLAAWLDESVRTARALLSVGRGTSCRFAMNEALAFRASSRAHGPSRESLVTFRQEEIRSIFDAANIDILAGLHAGDWPEAKVGRYASLVRERLGGFAPDVVVTHTPDAHLRAAFPRAVIVGTGCGLFSRDPFPVTTFYDPRGLWDRSTPAVFAHALLDRAAREGERELLERVRTHYSQHFEVTSPFAETEARLRKRFHRLALLPLQLGGEPGFDLHAPMRTQGEYLLHVLERVPSELGVVITEHPTGISVGDRIDEETEEWVAKAFPNAIFVDWRAAPSVGQTLVRHVDYVVSVSSSIGLQALLWRKALVSVGRSHLDALASVHGPASIDLSIDPASLPSRDGVLGWLLSRYYVPASSGFDDGLWLDAFFRRALDRAGEDFGPTFFEDSEAPSPHAGAWCAPLPQRPTVDLSALSRLVENGDFADWPRGEGPFFGSGPACRGWEVVASAGSLVEVRRVPTKGVDPSEDHLLPEDCVRITRSDAGSAPTFFLQRVPDVTRLAGAFVMLEFWARSPTRASIDAYFFQQLDSPRAMSRGTPARTFVLEPKWQRLRYVATLPPVGEEEARGARSHTEVAFAIPPGLGEAIVEMTRVSLLPGGVAGV
jgi:hypothetical protein